MGHLTVWSRRMGTAALLLWPVSLARGETTVDRIVEIRSYNLKAGTRDRFHERFEREALPMLRRFKVDVVAYGPSLHDRDSYRPSRSSRRTPCLRIPI